jgi:hypothetical protein
MVMVASAMFWLGVMADCKKPNNDEHYAVKLPEYNRSNVRHDEIFLDKLVIEHEQEVEGLTRNITALLQAVVHYEKLETFKKKQKTDAASDDVTKHPFASDEKTVTHHATPKEYADIFIAPHPLITSSKAIIDSAALIMPQFNAKKEFKGALCRFADNQTTSLNLFPKGGEVYFCDVPSEMIVDNNEPTILVSLEIEGSIKSVNASMWPWRSRNIQYKVANTCMVKDIECGIHLEDAGSCFHDWIIWHRMQGVEHFFLYDNNSKQDHPMLKAARIYVEQGVVTLIDWPYIMDGPDNNKVQRVQMNHAMFAFSRRVEWLGFFDVDEFFVPSEPGEVLERHSSEMGGAYKLLTMFGESVIGRNDSCSRPFLSIKLKMRNAQHPDFCFPKRAPNNTTTTTRLASCDEFHPSAHGSTKTFVRVGTEGPRAIKSPHDGMELGSGMHFVHFAQKYGCTNRTKHFCRKFSSLAESSAVMELERKLHLMHVNGLQACELADPPCY